MSKELPFMPTKPYWSRNDDEIAALRAKASELTAKLRGLESNNASWTEQQRVRSELGAVQRELDLAEVELHRARRRQQGHNSAPSARRVENIEVLESWQNAAGETVQRHAGGLRVIPKGANASNVRPVAEAPFATTVPYFER